ncbi:unnamed protein product [Rhodiola kirilowii]
MTEQQAAIETENVSTFPSENKRKLDDFEPQRPQPEDINGNPNLESADEKEAKKLRLDEKVAVDGNGHQVESVSALDVDKVEENPVENHKNIESEDKLVEPKLATEDQSTVGGHETENVDTTQEPTTDEVNKQSTDAEQPSKENPEVDGTSISAEDQAQPPSAETVQEDGSATKEKTNADAHTMSRTMEIPNNKVGVLIGKAGDTIRYLQINSGAKIQITRDAEADPRAPTRPVELIGSLESIEKAEKLIKDVISEADAGGVPSLVARGIATAQTAVAAEQIQMHVPNDKVGMIIGKGGETIKYLQATSGARIQLIPQHLPEGDQSTERIVRVSGDKKQIEIAREMIMEVMTQPVRHSPRFGGYNNQADRFRGAPGVWGPRGGHYGPPSGYDYHQRSYPSQNPLYRPPPYEHYPGPNYGPRSGYGSGWQQQAPMQRPPYDMYGRPGHFMDGSAGARGYPTAPNIGHIPSQANHNYGQPHNADYGYPSQYSHVAPAPSGYGHGYDEMKYGTQAPVENPYGGQGNAQPAYSQGYPGYGPSQQYGKPAPYSMAIPSQPTVPQTYGPSRPVQPEAPYQAMNPPTVQPYGQNVQPQQPAPYATGVPAQPSYPTYPTADGYTQQQQAAAPAYAQQATPGYAPVAQQAPGTYMQQAAPVYPQPAAQQAPGSYAQQAAPSYAQPVAQQAPAPYASQGMQPGSYASYPTSQPGYPDPSAATSAVYGYQATTTAADPNAVHSGPASSQQGYAQPQPAQTATYDQSVTQ